MVSESLQKLRNSLSQLEIELDADLTRRENALRDKEAMYAVRLQQLEKREAALAARAAA
jgi:hypothetical protein